MFLEVCMQINSVVFAFSRQITSKGMQKPLISFVQVISFCKMSSSRGFIAKPPPCVRPCPQKPNYYILAHLQCSLKFAWKCILWYLV